MNFFLPVLVIVFMLVGSGLRSSQAHEATPAPPNDAAEWRMYGANAARTGAITAPGISTAPTERWRLPADLSQQPSLLGPLVADGSMFLWIVHDQRLSALDLATGNSRWQADIGAPATAGSGADLNAAIADGVLFIVGTAGGTISSDAGAPLALFALDASTGQERWRVSFPEGGYISALAVVGSLLLFSREGPSGNAVYALDTASGQKAWRAPLPLSLAYISGGIAATLDTVYLPGAQLAPDTGALLALDLATGAERWLVATAGLPRYGAVVAEGRIFLATFKDDLAGITLEALDAETGAAQWQFAANEGTQAQTLDIRRIAAAHGLVYVDVTTSTQASAGYELSNHIIALDAATGTEQWRAVDLETPVVVGEVLYAGTYENTTDPTVEHALVALDAVTGEELWRLPVKVRVMTAGADFLLVESHEAVIAYGP